MQDAPSQRQIEELPFPSQIPEDRSQTWSSDERLRTVVEVAEKVRDDLDAGRYDDGSRMKISGAVGTRKKVNRRVTFSDEYGFPKTPSTGSFGSSSRSGGSDGSQAWVLVAFYRINNWH